MQLCRPPVLRSWENQFMLTTQKYMVHYTVQSYLLRVDDILVSAISLKKMKSVLHYFQAHELFIYYISSLILPASKLILTKPYSDIPGNTSSESCHASDFTNYSCTLHLQASTAVDGVP